MSEGSKLELSDPAAPGQAPVGRLLGPPRSFELLNAELGAHALEAEFYFLGGAVICQAFNPAPTTAHVSQLFKPTHLAYEAADRVRDREGLKEGWLHDAIRTHLTRPGGAEPYIDESHLRVFAPRPQYLLAVKCAAMRLGEDFREHDDVRYILRALDVSTPEGALDIVTRYFGERQLPPGTESELARLLSR